MLARAAVFPPAVDHPERRDAVRGQGVAIIGVDPEAHQADRVIAAECEPEQDVPRPRRPVGDAEVRVVPGVGPLMSPTSRQVWPRSRLARTRTMSFVPRARAWALKRSATRSPGRRPGRSSSRRRFSTSTPPSRTSRLSNSTPIVPVVSFLVKAASGVIRHAIVRVASAGSASAATSIVFRPRAEPGKRPGACWKSLSTSSARARPRSGRGRVDFELQPVVIAPEDRLAQVDRVLVDADRGGPERLEPAAVVGGEASDTRSASETTHGLDPTRPARLT